MSGSDSISGKAEEKLNYTPIVTGADRAVARQLIANAFRAARRFEGSDAGVDRLVAAINPLDRFIIEHGRDSVRQRHEIESGLTRHARGLGKQPVTISELLDLATASFGRRVSSMPDSVLNIIETSFRFLPTKVNEAIQTGSSAGMEPVRLEQRLKKVVLALYQGGLTTSDYRIYGSKPDPNAMRETPYRIITIPRLNREIAVCDQIGQASYVAQGQPGPLFWATYGKPQLRQHPDVTRVSMGMGWEERLQAALFAGNAVQPKIRVTAPAIATAFPLTEDLILTKALEHAAAHQGKLPSKGSGEVDGMPGQIWSSWNAVLRNQSRGLTRPDCKGLAHVFQIYGLKIGRSEDSKVVQQAIANIKAGKPHGLQDTHMDQSRLTEDLILTKALEYAAVHHGELPSHMSGNVDGMPGQTWIAWQSAVRGQTRGLTRPDCKGLTHLFQIYGLIMGRRENPEVVQQAIANIKAGKPHGLQDTHADNSRLTEDLLLTKALEYAAAHKKRKLPSQHSGAIDGMPGQTWNAWHSALRIQGRGLTRPACMGLAHLFQIYGLKTGRSENPGVVHQAIANIKAGKPHGLMEQSLNIMAPEKPQGQNGQDPDKPSFG